MRISDTIFDQLKRVVLDRSRLENIMPGNCKAIADDIFHKTNLKVSETTIKRMFGFANSEHCPSRYTLTSLSIYVGFPSWESFCEQATIEKDPGAACDLTSIECKARILTDNSLRKIRNRTGIPYSLTIPRNNCVTDFDYFLKSAFNFTCIVGNPGHGKSVLVSHIITNLFHNPDSPHCDSTLWLISIDDMPSNHTVEIESWINEQLGFDPAQSLLINMNEFLQKSNKKAVFIIDGINEQSFKGNKLPELLECVTDLICEMDSKSELKIVLSMRSTQWASFYDGIRSSACLQSLWYPGTYFNFKTNSNVPLLNKKEITKIFRNIDSDFQGFSSIDPRLGAQFKIPSNIQLYYQLREKSSDYSYQDEITSFEIIATFINQKVFLSKYSSEKTYLLTKLVTLNNIENKGKSVLKIKLLNDIGMFHEAYQDLLVQGVLVEEKCLKNSVPHDIIKFVHPHLFDYFRYLEIVKTFNQHEDISLIDYINERFKKYKHKTQLLQWILRHLLNNKAPTLINTLFHGSLTSSEKLHLIHFIAETIHWKSKQSFNPVDDSYYEKLHIDFINQLCQMDFADPYFGPALQSLLKLKNTPENDYFYRGLQACLQIIRFDKAGLSESIEYLRKSDIDQSIFPFNPTEYLGGVNDILNNSKLECKLWMQIDTFVENSPNDIQFNELNLNPQEKLSFLTVIMTCFFEKDPTRALALINSISSKYPQSNAGDSGYASLIANLEDLGNSYLKPKSGATKLVKIRTARTPLDQLECSMYNEILSLSTQIQVEINRKNYKTAFKIAKKALILCKKYKVAFFELVVYFNIIDIYDKILDFDKKKLAVDQVYRFMEQKNISLSIFQESFDVSVQRYPQSISNLDNNRNRTGSY